MGLGAGATGADHGVPLDQEAGRTRRPQTLAREAKGGLLDLSKLVSESIQEGRQAMAEREAQLRADNDLPRHDDEPDEPDAPPAA